MTKNFEYVAVTDLEDESLKINFSNNIDLFIRRYGPEYHWVKLSSPKNKLDAILEAKDADVFDSVEKAFLLYEYENHDLKDNLKKRFYRVVKTKAEKVKEIIDQIPNIRNSVFDVRIQD